MPQTSQMLADYPEIQLQVIAELRGAFLDGEKNIRAMIDSLGGQITDPTSVLMAFQEITDSYPGARSALDLLLAEGGEMREAQFSREFGSIRQMGPSKLEREQPWNAPESVAELLYHYGLIGRTYKGEGRNAHTIIFIPSDILPWLPRPTTADGEKGLGAAPVPPPPSSRMLRLEDAFLEDTGTLLGFLHTEGLRLQDDGAPNSDDIEQLMLRLKSADGFVSPFVSPVANANVEEVHVALLLHLARRLGWLRRADDERVRLTGNRVYAFLEQPRPEQRFSLWEAWRTSDEWNDLERIPGIDCSGGDWQNNPLQTREEVLKLLGLLQPGAWYSLAEVISAIKETAPDFQRPAGDYDSWYIRYENQDGFLRGFEHWDVVEGVLLRFLLNGPLYWLSAVELAEPSAGDDLLLSLSAWGARWLGHDSETPNEARRHPIVVEDDFSVELPADTPLMDRFRVERFSRWQASYPRYLYQINQRSLNRASDEGVQPERILAFLNSRASKVPQRVATGLQKFGEKLATDS
ncbi:MAG: hypothetical protein F4Z82_15555 [Caldilineaceae bacterium SB0668_bin_21]|nr:hypothetical protein [Caldilineaceae bacterium SB0668_bin_21]MYC21217.1 hypothetical protein [Caldilineaceae bacterium SB0662_bin_25]